MKTPLTLADFELAAATLAVPVAAIRAFAEVESRGAGFLPDGRPVILFERHIFRRQLIAHGANLATVTDLENRRPDLCNKTPGGYGASSKEWQRLDDAVQVNRAAALESCSWGTFQVLGLHWKALGYASVQEFVNAMYRSNVDHLDCFVRYIQATPKALAAMKKQDWKALAIAYNGPAQKGYDTKLAEAFARYN